MACPALFYFFHAVDGHIQAKLYDMKMLPVVKIQARKPGIVKQLVQELNPVFNFG